MMLRYQKTIEGCRPIEGKTVLDVGCGPGHYSIALARSGALSVCGIDFAKAMVGLAGSKARAAGVDDRCSFLQGDFLAHAFTEKFDYVVVMGFMDYVEQPVQVIEKVLSRTKVRAFFSFPAAGGFLAWQRTVRYRSRCPLFMYTEEQLRGLFAKVSARNVEIEKASRDYFVTVHPEQG
jgi:2-polyprenyl-3-methyl-5-hydroxy-6-metoxy-1,4-benzoquinol methylase